MMRRPRGAAVQIVGFGPAGLGIAVAADRLGVLERLLSAGVVFVERARDRASAGAQRFPWKVVSNSPGGDFLVSIAERGNFADVFLSPIGRRIKALHESPVWLPEISVLMNVLSKRVEDLCAARAQSGVLYGAAVAEVVVEEDQSFTSYDAGGRPLVRSQSVVIATGASEHLDDVHPFARAGARVVASSAVFAGDFDVIVGALGRGGSLTVLGGSHSAFGAAHTLLREFGGRIGRQQLRLACRRPVELYFSSVAEARAYGFRPEPRDICPESGEVNRFNGLRGQARQLYLAARDGGESRVRIIEDRALHPAEVSEQDALVSATGYRPRRVRFRAANGEPISLAFSRSFGCVNEDCELLTRTGEPLPGAFGMGIGYPRLDANRYGRVGVNRFHGAEGAQVVRGVLKRLDCRSSANYVGTVAAESSGLATLET